MSIHNLLIIVVGVLSFACKKDVEHIDAEANNPDWQKLTIPAGREAFAVAGDIDKTLLVTTWTKAYYSIDQGKTWELSKDFSGKVPGLYNRNDTVFALDGTLTDEKGYQFASDPVNYFTTDYGLHWVNYFIYFNKLLVVKLDNKRVTLPSGVSYYIQANTTPVSSSSSFVNPSDLYREDKNGRKTLVNFPFKRELLSLHLDNKNRLYIAASGSTYLEENNNFYCCDDTMPAIVYVSKNFVE
jgi:hypothetical protein